MDIDLKESKIEIKTFIKFILEFNYDLLSDPTRGEIYKIMHLFHNYCRQLKIEVTDVKDHNPQVEGFLQFINRLNEISGDALKVNNYGITPLYFTSTKIEWISFTNLILLDYRMDVDKPREIDFIDSKTIKVENYNSPSECLLDIIKQPLSTHSTLDFSHSLVDNSTINNSYEYLEKALKKQSARKQLAKQKQRLKTLKKQYYSVCNDQSHNFVLGNICLNERDYNGNQTKPKSQDIIQIHNKIHQHRHSMNQSVFKCSQEKIHFLPILNSHTDLSLGDCSYLDTCHKMKTCRYLHYQTVTPIEAIEELTATEKCIHHEYTIGECFTEYSREIVPAQWINCDVRYLPFSILGKFSVIISDPAWDIHMSLPYGTCKDHELLSLPMHELQDEGIILLWVTGRSIEIGRKALSKWGYEISDEVIWIKLNQLKRTIVTGRTGHWLNHSKEHLLVGVKGRPYWLNKKMDIDIVVSGTRETSRKPDEIYEIVERIVGKHSRKLEIFGRDHNIRPGWLTIGNQLNGTSLFEQEVKLRYDEYIIKQKSQ